LKPRHSCPYSYRDGMQANGGLFPFILNTHITSNCFFYLHSPSNLPASKEPQRPSKYEDTSAHIGEGLGLSVFDVWIAAFECSTIFRNVSPHHQFTSQKKESSVTLLWKHLLPIGNRIANSRLSSIYLSIRIA